MGFSNFKEIAWLITPACGCGTDFTTSRYKTVHRTVLLNAQAYGFESHIILNIKDTQKGVHYVWRRRWDSNPRAREGKRISSAPRYDLFDTSPYVICVIYFNTIKYICQLLIFVLLYIYSVLGEKYGCNYRLWRR